MNGADDENVFAMHRFWKSGDGGEAPVHRGCVDFFRRVRHEVAEASYDFGCGLRGVDRTREGYGGPNGVQLVLEGCDDAEVPTTSVERPEEVGIVLFAGGQEATLGCDEIDGNEAIACHSVGSAKPSLTTPEGEPGNASRRHDASRCRETENLRLPVELCQRGAAFGPRPAPVGLDTDGVHL